MILQLFEIPCYLSGREPLCSGVIYKGNILCSVDAPVEVVCRDGIGELICRKSVGHPYVVWNKGLLYICRGEYPLVCREKYHIVKIQHTSLQRSHNLKSCKRLSAEWHGDLAQFPYKNLNPEVCGERKIKTLKAVYKLIYGI